MAKAYYNENGQYKEWSPDMVGALAIDGEAKTATKIGYGAHKYITQNDVSKPYWRIARVPNITEPWQDYSVVLLLNGASYDQGWGMCRFTFRTHDTSGGSGLNMCYATCEWLMRSRFAADQLYIGYNNTKDGPWYADLYFKAVSGYTSLDVTVLESSGRNDIGNTTQYIIFDDDNTYATPTVRSYSNTFTANDVGLIVSSGVEPPEGTMIWIKE